MQALRSNEAVAAPLGEKSKWIPSNPPSPVGSDTGMTAKTRNRAKAPLYPTFLILSSGGAAYRRMPSRPARGVRLPSPFDTPPSAATQDEERGVGSLRGSQTGFFNSLCQGGFFNNSSSVAIDHSLTLLRAAHNLTSYPNSGGIEAPCDSRSASFYFRTSPNST